MGGIRAAAIVGMVFLVANHTCIYAWQSFEAGTFVRSASVGDAVSAVNFGADSVHKNPGSLSRVMGTEVQFTASQEFDSAIFIARAGVMGNVDKFRYSVQLPIKTIQGLIKTQSDDSGQGITTGTYSDQQMSLMATLATDWNSASWGLTLRSLSQTIDSDSGSGFGFDIGVLKEISPQLSVGGSVRNLMTSVGWSGKSTETVPMAVSTGLRYLPQPKMQLMGELDYIDRKFRVNVGGTYGMSPSVELRAGVNSVLDAPQVRLGVGLNMGTAALDYGFSQVDLLGVSHRVGVRYVLL